MLSGERQARDGGREVLAIIGTPVQCHDAIVPDRIRGPYVAISREADTSRIHDNGAHLGAQQRQVGVSQHQHVRVHTGELGRPHLVPCLRREVPVERIRRRGMHHREARPTKRDSLRQRQFMQVAAVGGRLSGRVCPSIVTCRSSMTSKSADCVRGVARFTSSTSSTWLKIGPG